MEDLKIEDKRRNTTENDQNNEKKIESVNNLEM